jgi:hypothetical protein
MRFTTKQQNYKIQLQINLLPGQKETSSANEKKKKKKKRKSR